MITEHNTGRTTQQTLAVLAVMLLPCFGCRARGFQAIPFWPQAAVTPPVDQEPIQQPLASESPNASVEALAADRMQASAGREPLNSQVDRYDASQIASAQATKQAAVPAKVAQSPHMAAGLSNSVFTSSEITREKLSRVAQLTRQIESRSTEPSKATLEADSGRAFAPGLASTTAAVKSDTTKTAIPTIALRVTGVRTNVGPVRLAVFTNPNSFPTPNSAAWTSVVDSTNSTITVACPQTGRLAVAAYQDLNNDGELNRNRFGIPLEPFAFSNDAKGKRGPPTFSDAAVDTAEGHDPILLSLP